MVLSCLLSSMFFSPLSHIFSLLCLFILPSSCLPSSSLAKGARGAVSVLSEVMKEASGREREKKERLWQGWEGGRTVVRYLGVCVR